MMDRPALDIDRLIGEVVRQNGIRLEADDPAFALVSLNQMVLEETAARIVEQFEQTAKHSTESLLRVEEMAGRHLAGKIRDAAAELRLEIQTDLNAASLKARELIYRVHQAHSRPVVIKWLALGLLLGLLLFAAGFVVGSQPSMS